MIRVDYPQHDFRIKKEGDIEFIFDELRKRWIKLNPEEWVRQNFLQYLVKVKNYPGSLIAVEKEIVVGEMRKRFDILIYDQNHLPWMMIECKSMDVPLSDEVLNQVLRYSIAVPATYLMITNGHYCAAWQKKDSKLEILTTFPEWTD